MQPPVLLNIGGSKYATTVDALTRREPGSLLAAMFAGGAHRFPTTVRSGTPRGRVPAAAAGGGVLPDACKLVLIDCINERIGEEMVDSSWEAELTRKDVIKCIQADKVRFCGVNLSGLDLSKLDLSEVDFSCGCIKKTDFSHANLHKAKFGV